MAYPIQSMPSQTCSFLHCTKPTMHAISRLRLRYYLLSQSCRNIALSTSVFLPVSNDGLHSTKAIHRFVSTCFYSKFSWYCMNFREMYHDSLDWKISDRKTKNGVSRKKMNDAYTLKYVNYTNNIATWIHCTNSINMLCFRKRQIHAEDMTQKSNTRRMLLQHDMSGNHGDHVTGSCVQQPPDRPCTDNWDKNEYKRWTLQTQ